MSKVFTICSRQLSMTMIVATLFVALTSWVVQAQEGYPPPEDMYINDYAHLLNTQDAANIRNMFVDLKQAHGIEATVLTIDSVSDYNTGDSSLESFATGLFNTWSIGDKAKNNGVLLLVAVGDREVRLAGKALRVGGLVQGFINN